MVPPELNVIENDGKADIVERLERLLVDARNGRLTGVAYAALTTDNKVATSFATSDDGSKFTLLGTLDHLRHRMNTAIDRSWNG